MTLGETEHAATEKAAGRPQGVGLVSVIVPHLDDYDNLDACLTLLAEQSFPHGRTEIIVADNGSSRGLESVRRIVGTRGRVVEVAERGAGTGPQRRGSRIARRRDRVHRQRLPAGPALARRGPCRVAVCGFRRRPGRRPGRGSAANDRGRSIRERLRLPERALRQGSQFHRHRLDVRVALRLRCGRRVSRTGCRKIWIGAAGRELKGYRIGFASGSIVEHPARRTMPELKRKSRRLTLEWCEAARRDGKGPIFMLARHWAVLLSIAPHSLVALASKRLSGARNRILAVGALAQIRAYRFAVAHRAVLGSLEE